MGLGDLFMAWYCDRCGEKCSSFSSAKYNSKDNDDLAEHSIPTYINICGSCHSYLFDRSISIINGHDFNWRKFRDEHADELSRFNEKCKEFDVRFDLLNEETNLYWDEEIENAEYDDEDYDYQDEFIEDSLIFDDDANEKINNALHDEGNTAWYESLKEDAMNSYKTTFTTSLQNFITRLGLIISEVANRKFYGKSHYIEVLDYICHQIIEDDYLYERLAKVNGQANASKHTMKNINIDINKTLTDFNSMIDKLISVSRCDAFNICHVYNQKISSEVVCTCCGRINPEKYYRCKVCKNVVCDDCFNKEKKMCFECARE